MNRPNIVFAFADDWGRFANCYADVEGEKSLNHLVNTPNMNRVAREGVRFNNAFVPAPSCTPCRSAVLSGRHFWECGLGAILIGAVWDENIPTYPLLLEQAGYHIGYTYKVWAPGKNVNAPYGGKRTQYTAAGNAFCSFSEKTTEMQEDYGIEGAKQQLAEETKKNFDAFLEDRPTDKPFCYWWGPTNTHRPWKRGSGKNLWGIDPDELTGRLPAFLPDVHEIRQDFADYLGECEAVDAGLGALMERLEEIGELDNTLIVVSGDHGIPGMPRGKCNLYDISSQVALMARWPGKIPPNRVVDDFVNLKDLAPTFLQAAGEPVPESMSAKSILPIMTSENEGRIEEDRSFVVTGRERHVAAAREGYLPYPQRAIRTGNYLYIVNFEPDRWPMGDPAGLDDPDTPPPDFETLVHKTFVAYADLDGSPTKAWMIHHRGEEDVQPLFELGFGKRTYEELYDVRKDPDNVQNLAEDSAYAEVKKELYEQLMKELRENNDPRVVETPCRFEHAPYADPPQAGRPK